MCMHNDLLQVTCNKEFEFIKYNFIYSSSHIVQIMDFFEFLNDYCKEKSDLLLVSLSVCI